MTFTYNMSPGTGSTGGRRDAVRLLIRDTTAASAKYQDEELAFLLSESGNNVYRAAAVACRGLADGNKSDKSVGDLSISESQGAGQWLELAKRYDTIADMRATPFAGGISVSGKETYTSDTDIVQPAFRRDLHNNAVGASEPSPST